MTSDFTGLLAGGWTTHVHIDFKKAPLSSNIQFIICPEGVTPSSSSGSRLVIIGVIVSVLLAIIAIVAFFMTRWVFCFFSSLNICLKFLLNVFDLSAFKHPERRCRLMYCCKCEPFLMSSLSVLQGDGSHPDTGHMSSQRQLLQDPKDTRQGLIVHKKTPCNLKKTTFFPPSVYHHAICRPVNP